MRAKQNLVANVTYRTTEVFDLEGMARLIDEAVAEPVDALAVSVPSRADLWPAIQRALDAGIPTVALNSCDGCLFDPDTGEPTGVLAWFGQNETEAGKQACEALKAEGATLVVAPDTEARQNVGLLQRAEGCRLAGLDVRVADVPKDNVRAMRSIVQAAVDEAPDPTTTAILALAGTSVAAISPGQMRLPGIAFDFSPDAEALLLSGDLAAAIDQQQYLQGYLPVVYLVNLVGVGQRLLDRVILTGPGFVDAAKAPVKGCEGQGVFFLNEPPPYAKGRPRDADPTKECPPIDRARFKVTMVTSGADTSPYWREVKNGALLAAADLGLDLVYEQEEVVGDGSLADLSYEALAARLGPEGGLIISPDLHAAGSAATAADETVGIGRVLAGLNGSDTTFPVYGVGGPGGLAPGDPRVPRATLEAIDLMFGAVESEAVARTAELLGVAGAAGPSGGAYNNVCSAPLLCLDPDLGVNRALLDRCTLQAELLGRVCSAEITSEVISFDGSNPTAARAKLTALGGPYGAEVALDSTAWVPQSIAPSAAAASAYGFSSGVFEGLTNAYEGVQPLDFGVNFQPWVVGYFSVFAMGLELLTTNSLAANKVLATGPFTLWNAGNATAAEIYTTPPYPDEAVSYFRCSLPGVEFCAIAEYAAAGGTPVGLIAGLCSAVAVIVLALIAVVSVYNRRMSRLRDEAENWRIEYSELEGMEGAEELGAGAFGKVVKAKFRGSWVAVKQVSKELLGAKEGSGATLSPGTTASARSFAAAVSQHATFSAGSRAEKMLNEEIRQMAKLRHPNIVMLMAACREPQSGDLCLVTELLQQGSMQDVIDDAIPFDMATLVRCALDIVKGMAFLHNADPEVVHNDIKPSNILVDSNFGCKVADFGLAGATGVFAGGTPEYMAPELITLGQAGKASDVYAFGITLWQIVARETPFALGGSASSSLSQATFTSGHSMAGLSPGNSGRSNASLQSHASGASGVFRKLDRSLSASRAFKAVAQALAVGSRPDLAAMRKARKDCPEELMDIVARCWAQNPAERPAFTDLIPELENLLTDVKAEMQRNSSNTDQDLLYKMMPVRVAEQLKAGQTVAPEEFDHITLFFSDIVGYTSISATLPPAKVMDLLDRVYTKMDSLSSKHGLFKVETIGDAYFCVANLPEPQADHAVRICRFAQEVVAEVSKIPIDPADPGSGFVRKRVGIHSGPVLASVVGDLNPRYCLFGDSVNTTSRMESNSKPLKVQLSPQAYDTLKAQDPALAGECLCRGEINVKGKGKIRTWWLPVPHLDVAALQAAAAPPAPDTAAAETVVKFNAFVRKIKLKRGQALELLELLSAGDFKPDALKGDVDAALKNLRK